MYCTGVAVHDACVCVCACARVDSTGMLIYYSNGLTRTMTQRV